MEKVKLTKEQSIALEKMRNCHHLRNDKDAILVKHASGWTHAYYALNEIPMLTFAQLVLNDFSYEIEPEQPKFQLGSEVIDVMSKNCPIITVTNQDEKHLYGYWGSHITTCLQKKNARFATQEEIYWKKTLGREKVGDYRYGDILTSPDHVPFVIANKTDTEAGFIEKSRADEFRKKLNLKGLLPAESFKSFPKENA